MKTKSTKKLKPEIPAMTQEQAMEFLRAEQQREADKIFTEIEKLLAGKYTLGINYTFTLTPVK